MTERVLRSILTMPPEYFADGTELAEVNGWVVAINGRLGLRPIACSGRRPWAPMVFKLVKDGEPKSCPKCGGEGQPFCWDTSSEPGREGYSINCEDCSNATPIFPTQAEATADWNDQKQP